MSTRVFVDGQEGTTGLKIFEYLSARNDIEILRIFSRWPRASSGSPYAQSACVRNAVLASISVVAGFSTSEADSRDATSGNWNGI